MVQIKRSPSLSTSSSYLFAAVTLLALCLSLLSASLFWKIHETDENPSVPHHSPSHLIRRHKYRDRLGKIKKSQNGYGGDEIVQNNRIPDDHCLAEFHHLKQDQVPGLNEESLERSRAWVGNKERLYKLARTAKEKERPLNIVVSGGSISVGHGINDPPNNRYSAQLEQWLNKFFPLDDGKQHTVHNIGAHGADMCNLAKRIHPMLEDLAKQGVKDPDMFILEFAVNDYQGQDHVKNVDFKFDVFFEGFQDIALCAEVVVNKLLRENPNAPVMFLEFRTAIPARRTAQLLHVGVAQHYEVPVVSYAEAMYPEYLHLLSLLNVSESLSAPKPTNDQTSTVLPYPYGCAPCRQDDILNQFRKNYCQSVCKIMNINNIVHCNVTQTPPDRQPCYPPMFAHDCVHPSRVGHSIARDLIVHAIASTMRDDCQAKPYMQHIMPESGWLLESPLALASRANFEIVQDTMQMYSRFDELKPVQKSAGWSIYSDSTASHKPGWISTNSKGNETISFMIDLPQRQCYAVYVAVLRSYEGMGQFTIEIEDMKTNKKTSMDADGLWKPHISVWSDIQASTDNNPSCTGKCRVSIRTHPQVDGRSGNKVKVLTLSARKCLDIK